MNRIFSSATLFIPVLFAPFTLLLILSQNTVPGDLLYPYKRGVEILILAAASVSPTTKAYFQTNLADRRYTEAEMLLLASGDVSALDTFVEEIRQTENTIANVSDTQKKEELEETLIAKIDDYQSRLTQIKTQVNVQNAIQENSVETPDTISLQEQEQPNEAPVVREQTQVIVTSSRQDTRPTATPTVVRPSSTRVVQPTRVAATKPSTRPLPSTPFPTATITPPPSTPTQSQIAQTPPAPSASTVGTAIEKTKDELEDIKKRTKTHSVERKKDDEEKEEKKHREEERKKEEESDKEEKRDKKEDRKDNGERSNR